MRRLQNALVRPTDLSEPLFEERDSALALFGERRAVFRIVLLIIALSDSVLAVVRGCNRRHVEARRGERGRDHPEARSRDARDNKSAVGQCADLGDFAHATVPRTWHSRLIVCTRARASSVSHSQTAHARE